MAIDARLGCWLIEQYQFSLDFMLQGMALVAAHFLVAAGEGELRAFIVIEGRRFPALNRVAVRARRNAILGGELSCVCVGVASVAVLRRSFELDVMRASKRFMAIAASDHAVRSDQIEFCLRVVEPLYVNPGANIVAGFATRGCSIHAAKGHAIVEFTLVRIVVARRAGAVLEFERQDFILPPAQPGLVAFGAGYGDVGPGKSKARILVFGDRKCGAVEILYGVAVFAAILVRRRGELLVMFVFMAIQAGGEFDLIDRVF